jgi:type IV pilus assembly protein PilW
MNPLSLKRFRSRHAARGFTLVELMIALVIGLFLTGGLLTLVFAMRRSTTNQAGMSQLQDDLRMGMSILTSAVQSAGYYPNPLANTAISMFPAVGAFAPGQSITGTHTNATTPDTFTVRYATAGSSTPLVKDNTINCAGQMSTTPAMWTMTLQVDTVNSVLQCVLSDGVNPNVTLNLVTGVTNMQVSYGVQSSPLTPTNSADSYMTADAITAALWPAVVSVKITLTYANPLKNQPGQSLVGPTIQFTRVIAVMNNTGVDT